MIVLQYEYEYGFEWGIWYYKHRKNVQGHKKVVKVRLSTTTHRPERIAQQSSFGFSTRLDISSFLVFDTM
jgi:hypothetical protein